MIRPRDWMLSHGVVLHVQLVHEVNTFNYFNQSTFLGILLRYFFINNTWNKFSCRFALHSIEMMNGLLRRFQLLLLCTRMSGACQVQRQ